MFIVKSDFYYALGGYEMKKIVEFFSGKKSYLSLAGIIGWSILYTVGAIDSGQFMSGIITLGGMVGVSFRLAIAKAIYAGEKAIEGLREIENKLPKS